jgi:hypothetical protein
MVLKSEETATTGTKKLHTKKPSEIFSVLSWHVCDSGGFVVIRRRRCPVAENKMESEQKES